MCHIWQIGPSIVLGSKVMVQFDLQVDGRRHLEAGGVRGRVQL